MPLIGPVSIQTPSLPQAILYAIRHGLTDLNDDESQDSEE